VGRLVVDQTRVAATYDFVLRFTPDPAQLARFGGLAAVNTAELDGPPDISTAFEQQLGLKRFSQAGPTVDTMVIHRIERPSPT